MLTRRSCLTLGGGLCLWVGLGGLAQGLFPDPTMPPPMRIPQGAAMDLESHVLSRLTYGVTPALRRTIAGIGIEQWIERQLDPLASDPAAEAASRGCWVRDCSTASLYEFHPAEVRRQLSSATFLRAVAAERQLHEIMVEFWNDHFNVDIGKNDCAYLKADDERVVARSNALGSFPAMLRASLTSPGMLWYLDGRENHVSPGRVANENHARELLELHTLGVHGGYSQADVMAIARCLSGYSVRARHEFHLGRVVFQPQQHDDGEKWVLGTRIPAGLGERDLDAVTSILAHHPATAEHLASKWCRRFISDDPPAGAVQAVATTFRETGGDIPSCLRCLFQRAEFRGEGQWSGTRGGKFKRPFHYLVSALRATQSRCQDATPFLEHLEILGQSPYRCPTPDGYGDRRSLWQDGLWWRWKVVDDLAHGRIAGMPAPLAPLLASCGGMPQLAAHVLGRGANALEQRELRTLSDAQALALLLASPQFQRC